MKLAITKNCSSQSAKVSLMNEIGLSQNCSYIHWYAGKSAKTIMDESAYSYMDVAVRNTSHACANWECQLFVLKNMVAWGKKQTN